MRPCLLLVLSLLSLPALADTLQALYQTAGWPEQRSHFSDALQTAQQRYQASLPPALYETLLSNSNRRFAAEGMEQRAQSALRSNLGDPTPALSILGVSQETSFLSVFSLNGMSPTDLTAEM